jgi:hypothetical protein
MPSISSPFGLKPISTTSGTLSPEVVGRRLSSAYNGISPTYATAIYKWSPIIWSAANGTFQLAAATGAIWGVFLGVSYDDATGSHKERPYWPAGGVTGATNVVATVLRAMPDTVYEIQADNTLTVNSIGREANFSNIGIGSTITGFSKATLGVSTLTTTAATAQLQILGYANEPNNLPSDAFPNMLVRINQIQAGPASVVALV